MLLRQRSRTLRGCLLATSSRSKLSLWSVGWKDHADHRMSVLLDPRGPFYKCDMQKHRDPEHLEPKKAPTGWFPDVSLRNEQLE
jgi:hypothetical protein